MVKSYNQRYKESGTTLSYKEWRKREDEKMASFDGITPAYKSLQDSFGFQKTKQEMMEKGGFKEKESGKTILGINKGVLIVAGAVIVIAIGYKIYKSRNK